MNHNEIIRWILISSVIIVVFFSIISYIVIFLKIRKKRQLIRKNQELINRNLLKKDSEIKMYSRKDFGQSDEVLQNLLKNTISHEIVEFCINTCIRNEYTNVLLVGNVEPYEVIVISNKANTNVYVRKDEFQIEKYNELIENNSNIKSHNIHIINELNNSYNNWFDSIIILNSYKNFENLFNNNINFLSNNGMFIIANTKSNKKSLKSLIKIVKNLNYRYENINWYTGFITIVKSFV